MKAVFISALAITSLVWSWLFSDFSGVHPAVSISGLSTEKIGTYRDLKSAVMLRAREVGDTMIQLRAGNRTIAVPLKKLGVSLNVDAMSARAWLYGREIGVLERLRSRLPHGPVEIPLLYRVEDTRKLLRFCRKLNSAPKNAVLTRRNGRLHVDPETPGVRVREDLAHTAVIMGLAAGAKSISVPTEIVPAKVAREGLLSTTRYKISSVNLKIATEHAGSIQNISRAVGLCGVISLKPGQRFSFNRYVGPRTASNGFTMGKVLENGQPALGMGGGVCVCSTLVFQASFLSGLTILERHCHSRVPSYTKVGTDAMVNLPGKQDLVIQNPYSVPVVIDVYRRDRMLRADVYSAKPLNTNYAFAIRTTAKGSQIRVTTFRIQGTGSSKIFESRYSAI